MISPTFRTAKGSSEDPEDATFSSSTENDDEAASKPQQEVDEPLLLFTQKSVSSSPMTSPTTSSSSPQSSSLRRSPINMNAGCDDISSSGFPGLPSANGVQVYNRPYTHPFVQSIGGHSTYTNLASSETEKFRKLKQKKEKRETRKEKNVVSSFNTGDESNYNVDSVLRSLGELEKTGEGKKHNNSSSSNNASNNSSSTTNGSKTSNGSSGKLLNGKHAVNGNVKARRKSNDKNADVDADDKKSTSDDEASTDASSNYSSAAELNQLPDTFTAKNVVLIDEADLKRQSSRSSENLNNFTKVTKKQKRKKRFPEEPHAQAQAQPQRNVHTLKSGNRSPILNGESEKPTPQPTRVASIASPSASVDTHDVDADVGVGIVAVSKQTSPMATNLDLSTDFPPLLDAPVGSGSAPVWPIVRPSLQTPVSPKSSDKMAVIHKDESNSSEPFQAQDTPDLMKQVKSLPDLVASSALPDVACQVGLTCDQACPMTPPAESECGSVAETESFFVDSEKENTVHNSYNSEDVVAPNVVDADADDNIGFTFGFELNEELLSMTFADGDALKQIQQPETFNGSHPDHLHHHSGPQLQLIEQHKFFQQQQQLVAYELSHGHPGLSVEPQTFSSVSTGVALHLEDNAIVCFGESIPDLNISSPTQKASDSGIDQATDNEFEDGTLVDVRSNIGEIVSYVRNEWLKVQSEAGANSPKVRYYSPSVGVLAE